MLHKYIEFWGMVQGGAGYIFKNLKVYVNRRQRMPGIRRRLYPVIQMCSLTFAISSAILSTWSPIRSKSVSSSE